MTWHRKDDPDNPAPRDGTRVLLLLNPPKDKRFRAEEVVIGAFGIQAGYWRIERHSPGYIPENSIRGWQHLPLPEPPQ